jgi:hypothetical protein
MVEDFQKNKNSSSADSFMIDNDSLSIGTPWRLMVFSLFMFTFSIFIYFGLKFGYDMYLEGQLSALDEKSEQLSAEVTEEEQSDFLSFYSQINNLESVLSSRDFGHNIFKFLENNTIPAVYYESVSYFNSNQSISLKGFASDMKRLVEQVSIFSKSEKVKEAIMNDVSIQNNNDVGFEISIKFNSNFLNKPFN